MPSGYAVCKCQPSDAASDALPRAIDWGKDPTWPAGTPLAWHDSYYVMKRYKLSLLTRHLKFIACAALVSVHATINGQPSGPQLVDPNLRLSTVVSGLEQPTSMAFLGDDDILVLEKATGKVKRITGGAVA